MSVNRATMQLHQSLVGVDHNHSLRGDTTAASPPDPHLHIGLTSNLITKNANYSLSELWRNLFSPQTDV